MTQTKPAIIKCKFCEWQIQKWWTNKKGKRVQGYSALERHVMMEHPDKWEKIEAMEVLDETNRI